MGTQLTIVNSNNLSLEERQEIDAHIDQVISRHKNNRYEINKLVFESVSALTASENYSNELHSQGAVKKFFGGLTGKNKELQRNIDNSLARSQYASQQTLQKLAEQNLMSFELITAVNNKLNASLVAVENEINNIYGTLVTFFKQSKSDIIQLENRVERLERNVNLLNWQNSIEYQMFNGVEYAELDDISKIVCLVRDFYDITKGQWTTSDLLLLKTAMATIDIAPKAIGNYFDFVKSVCYNKTLSNKLFSNKLIVRQPNPEYLTMISGINKLNLLGTKEHYVVDTVLEQVGPSTDAKTISENLTKSYIAQEASVNIQANIPYFDMMLETLYCLKQAEDESLFGDVLENEFDVPLSLKFEKASELFRTYNPQKALPLLEELSNAGYTESNLLLYWLYKDGYYIDSEYFIDNEKADYYLNKGYTEGDDICTVVYAIFGQNDINTAIAKQALPKVESLANQGDVYASYTLGLAALNGLFGEKDSIEAMKHYIKACVYGFYRAAHGVFTRYYKNELPFSKEDSVHLQIWASEIMKYNCPKHLIDVASMFMHYNQYGFEWNDSSYEDWEDDNLNNAYYKKAFELYNDLLKTGNMQVYVDLGVMYRLGWGTPKNESRALEYLSFAANNGDVNGQYELGQYYYYKDKDKAKYWYSKAAEQGHEGAKVWLHRINTGWKLSDALFD